MFWYHPQICFGHTSIFLNFKANIEKSIGLEWFFTPHEPLSVSQNYHNRCTLTNNLNILRHGFFLQLDGPSFMYYIQHCYICHPSGSTVSEDAEIECRTVATLAVVVRRSNHWATVNLIHCMLDLIHTRIDLIHSS